MVLIGLDTSGLPPFTYQRNALTGMVKYGDDKKFVSINFLKGQDNTYSVPESVKQLTFTKASDQLLKTNIPTPSSNLVIGISSKIPLFFKRIILVHLKLI